MKKRILTIVSAFALCGALAVAAIPRSAGAEEKSRLFRFGFAAEVSLESPAGTVEFTAENDAGIVYAFGGDTLTVTAKDAAGKTHEVTATAAGESVSLDFWWTGSAYKTKIDGTEYAVNASFGEDVTAKASLKTTGTGVSLSGVRDGGIRSQAHVVNSSATLTDLGDGLYNIKGNVNDSMLVQMDPVAVTDGSIVRISLAMHGAGAADDNDTWLSLMLGTDIRNGQYGPNETTYSSSGRGPHVALLMRFFKDGHFMGNTFNMGNVAGSIPDISGVSKRLECDFKFSSASVSVSLGGVDVGTFAGLPMQSYFAEGAYFNLRTHGTGASKADYDVDIQINGKVSASDAEYDLAAGADKVKIPLKLMGSELLGVYDENGRKLGADVCAAAETELSLDKSLFGAAEGDERAFYLVSTGGQSRFRVLTTDTTRVIFSADTLAFDKAAPADLTFSFDKRTLRDLVLSSEHSFSQADYGLTDRSLTLKKEYLEKLEYGSYSFTLSGTRVSGEPSAASSVTVRVMDGRAPALRLSEIEIDAADLDGVSVAVDWYDASFSGLKTGTDTVETAGYTVGAEGLRFTRAYLEALPYGPKTFTLTTSKNVLTFEIVKTDSRAASVSGRLEIEKADVKEKFDVVGKWYDESVNSVALDGKEIGFIKTPRAVRLDGKTVLALSLGEHTLKIETNERTLTAVLEVRDGRIPVRADDAAYDLGFPSDVALPFIVYDNTLIAATRGGEPFPAASIEGSVVTIARGWFEAAGFAKGAEVTFELAWTSADGGTKNSATVVVKVVNTRLGEIGSFNLGSKNPLVFPVDLNGSTAVRVRIGGSYVPFEYADGKITVPYAALEELGAGETAVVVETDRYLNEGVVEFIDDRKPAAYAAEEYFSGDFKIQIKTYAYRVTAVSMDGRTVAADGYSYADGVLTVFSAAIGEISEGNHALEISTEAEDGKSFLLKAAFTAASKQPPVAASGLTYSLADGGTLGVNVDFKNNLSLKGVLLEGKPLETSLWRVGSYGSLLLSAGCFEGLTAGTYTFTLVCDRANGEFTVTVSDPRVNEFLSDGVSVNAGEKEIALRAEIRNTEYKIFVDGKETSDYVYKDGTLVLGKTLVGTLGAGTHTVGIVTAGGEDTATIEIYKKNTAVSVLAGAGIGLGITAVLAAALFIVPAVKRRKS